MPRVDMRFVGAVCMLTATLVAWAQTPVSSQPYPSQSVRIIVPFTAGSVTDILARSLGDKLAEGWHQLVIVENRPGISGTAAAANAAPDGYTLALVSNGHTVIGSLNNNLPFDPVKDFAGVTQVASVPLVLIVPPTFPAKTLKELIALAKEKPGTLNFASAGLGSTTYIAGETFKRAAGIDITHVPYRGTPESLTSVMRGDAHLFFAPANLAVELIQTGKVRPIALVGSDRNAALPEVPTFAEAGLPGFVYDAWFALLVPAKTPRAVVEKINRDVGQILQTPDVVARLSSQGVQAIVSSPDRLDAMIRDETALFGAMIKEAGLGRK